MEIDDKEYEALLEKLKKAEEDNKTIQEQYNKAIEDNKDYGKLLEEHNTLKNDYIALAKGLVKPIEDKVVDEFDEYCKLRFGDAKRK